MLVCSHPVAVATRALADVANNAASGQQDLETLQTRVSALQQLFKASKGDELQQAIAGIYEQLLVHQRLLHRLC